MVEVARAALLTVQVGPEARPRAAEHIALGVAMTERNGGLPALLRLQLLSAELDGDRAAAAQVAAAARQLAR